MATFLDIGLLSHISIIFPMLLVYVLVYAILQTLKPLGGDKGIDSIVALCIAAIVLFSEGAIGIINYVAPWFAIIFIFIFFMITGFRLMGTSSKAITEVMDSWGTLHYWLLSLGILIMIGALSNVFGPELSPHGSDYNQTGTSGTVVSTNETGQGYQATVRDILFHPRVLGLALILLIIVFTIRVLTEPSKG
jgi:phosphatidylglycerophosphate synthase